MEFAYRKNRLLKASRFVQITHFSAFFAQLRRLPKECCGLVLLLPVLWGNPALADTPDLSAYERGRFEIKSANGLHSLAFDANVYIDSILVESDGSYTGASATQFRQARLAVTGRLYGIFDYAMRFDMKNVDNDSQSLQDIFITYNRGPLKVTFGQKDLPYSTEGPMSAKHIVFVERSMVSEFFNSSVLGVGGRAPGVRVAWRTAGDSLLLEGGYFFLRSAGGQESTLEDGHGVTGHAIFSRQKGEGSPLFHIGVAAGYRQYDNDGIAGLRLRPDSSTGDALLDTGVSRNGGTRLATIDSYTSLNVSGIFARKRFWVNGEYFYGKFDNSASGGDEAGGYYIQTGFFLTPDTRSYDPSGYWGGVTPVQPLHEGGTGAWEVALRYGWISLGAGQIHNSSSHQSGSTLTAALNWYPNPNVRFQLNYTRAFCDKSCAWRDGDPEFLAGRVAYFF